MKRFYYDCETCGLHGVPVIGQWAIEDGPIEFHDYWNQPVEESFKFIDMMLQNILVGFNLVFDHFHTNKIWNILNLLAKEKGNVKPVDHIDLCGVLEEKARDGLCLKPASSLDLMLYARKTELQITMERSDIVIRRVPTVLAWQLAELLDSKIQLEPILFAGYKKKNQPRFVVKDCKKTDGTIDKHLSNVVLKFRPSSSLKNIAANKLGAEVTQYSEIEIDRRLYPKEFGYAPYAMAVGRPGAWNKAWPDLIRFHINHWQFNKAAREYAKNDIVYTRGLDHYWKYPAHGDNDSILACQVAASRWKGYKVDLDKLKKLIENYEAKLKYPMAPNRVKEYIGSVLNPIDRTRIEKSTAKIVLMEFASWKNADDEYGRIAGERAQNVLDARKAKKKIEVFKKLYKAGRFHVSCKIIGSLSNRMSGADGLNPQGIDKTKEARGCFPLAFDDEELVNGDMRSFEVGIAAADYGDPKLAEELSTCEKCNIPARLGERGWLWCQTCINNAKPELHRSKKSDEQLQTELCDKCGLVCFVNKKKEKHCFGCDGAITKKFHALFALGFWPDMTYQQVLDTEGTDEPIYNWAKNGAFATLYGAQAKKLMDTLHIQDEDLVKEGLLRFWRTYRVAGQKRKAIEYDFATLYQDRVPGPIKIKEANDSIESLLGFRRYFTLENYLVRELYAVAENPPKPWNDVKVKVVRGKKGVQFACNALRSALYGTAFATQNSNIRQAANHRIQATGAGITKSVQVRVWSFQPVGVHEWHVRPMNVHDELQNPCKPSIKQAVIDAVYDEVEKFRPIVPLIGIDFGPSKSWADK